MTYLVWGLALAGITASAQSFDSSADGNLFGDYFVREVMLSDVDQNSSAVGRARSIVGTITFDGQGNYDFSGTLMDASTGQTATITGLHGAYQLAGNGFFAMDDLIDNTQTDFGGTGLFGTAGLTSIVASATEGSQKNILVAIPAGTSITTASLQRTYNVAFIDFLQGNASLVRDGYFTLATAGDGNFGNVTVSGAMANLGGTNTTQTLTNVTYEITNEAGSGVINFPPLPSLSTLVTGQKDLFVSADGSIFLAANPGGYDLMVGIPALTVAATNGIYQGTYFIAGLEDRSGVDAFSGRFFRWAKGLRSRTRG